MRELVNAESAAPRLGGVRRLSDVAAHGDSARTAIAAFLMGQTADMPLDCLGAVVPRDQIPLYLGRLSRARRSSLREPFYRDIGWEGGPGAGLVFLADIARRQGDANSWQTCLDRASAGGRLIACRGSIPRPPRSGRWRDLGPFSKIAGMHPPEPCLVHRLPPAPHFVGRELELEALRAWWRSNPRGVIALVGLGGAGKTAVASRFLDELLSADKTPRPDGLFVWSFYQEPDAGLFLRELHRYFAGPNVEAIPAKGVGLLHLLREALAAGGPHLLVLDGLERVQRQGDIDSTSYGQIEDPLLKGLLTRIAEGNSRAAVLATSRFPLIDLHPFREHGYSHVDIGGLDHAAAIALLRSRGVIGADDTLASIADGYGAHALSLDHLGGVIGQFFDGDPLRAPEAPMMVEGGADRQALRLARLLRAYEEHLPPAELALLCRLSLLRRSVTDDQIAKLFLCSPAVHARTVRELAEIVRQMRLGPVALPDVARNDLATSIQVTIEEALCAAPLAGPEQTFRQEVCLAAETFFELYRQQADVDFGEVAHLYSDKSLDTPSDQLPLSADERQRLRAYCALYLKLREPAAPPKPWPIALGKAYAVQDVNPAEKRSDLLRLQRRLRYLVFKHFALRQIRELCRLAQQKWSLAGPLAQLDAAGLRELLGALAGRHLVLREGDGSYSVHPAVRDHFSRLAAAPEQRAWHDIIRVQLVSLVQRPGRRLPEEPAHLDLVEEAIHHALEAGRSDEAWWLYADGLGGVRHLAWKLGEIGRGLRILRRFEPCPDRWALAWYLRALGEMDEAYRYNDLPFFRADICLLQGRLPDVAAHGDSARTAIAAFLMGQTADLPPDCLGAVVPRDQILLYLGRLSRARHSGLLEPFYRDIGWEGDRARSLMFLADIARRQGDANSCQTCLDKASAWILHSGSVEHLCLYHLVRARAARAAGDGEKAQRAVDEGLHLARQHGLGLYHIELLCEHAEICVARADVPAAEQLASAAWERAFAVNCQFMWGAAEAGHLWGQALAAQRHHQEARVVLEKTLVLRERIGHPKTQDTEKLLELVSG